MSDLDRRSFLAAGAAGAAGVLGGAHAAAAAGPAARPVRAGAARAASPVVISSANGLRKFEGSCCVDRAMELLRDGADPAEAVVEGVALVESNPDDSSVGLGGLPNENGVVQLDASVMHGPTHKAGAVASIENIENPARVALKVLRHTDHVMLVGAGALAFAKRWGFEEVDLLTDKAREAWLRWRRNLNPNDDWLDDDQTVAPGNPRVGAGPIPHTHGTIHCAAVDANGDIGACTTTSGLSYKLAGRVGDSPIIGAGMFVDNEVGAAGGTGRGESVIQSCGAFQAVQHMAAGDDPETACLKVLRWIAAHTKRPSLLRGDGRPDFGVTMYALRKDGVFGSATMHGSDQRENGPRYAVHDAAGSRYEWCKPLFT